MRGGAGHGRATVHLRPLRLHVRGDGRRELQRLLPRELRLGGRAVRVRTPRLRTGASRSYRLANGGCAMPQKAWSDKRERQYDHIKEGLRKRGTPNSKAEEIAART